MVCHQSGVDAHPALKRDPKTDPKPDPKPEPEPAKGRRETRKERRRRRFSAITDVSLINANSESEVPLEAGTER
jgi:hypothetical protein